MVKLDGKIETRLIESATRSTTKRNVNRHVDSYYLLEPGFSMTDIVSGAFNRRGFCIHESL